MSSLRAAPGALTAPVCRPGSPVRARVAVVSGGQRGIGRAICEQLAARPGLVVVMGSLDLGLGREVAAEIGDNVEAWRLDITSAESVAALAAHVAETHGGLDILVNNAGIAFKGDRFSARDAAATIEVNTTGTGRMCEAFLPLMRPGGVVVNVCSRTGRLGQVSEALQAEFSAPDLTVPGVHALMARFVADIEAGEHRERGWSNSMYGISKLGAIALTKVYARLAPEGVKVVACCPGFVRSEMSSWQGSKSCDEGATTPVWLALAPEQAVPGETYGEEAVLPWTTGPQLPTPNCSVQ